MVRQDPGVQHVRVGQDDIGPLPDGPPRVLRRVPIISERAQVGPHLLDDPVQFFQLIFRERLGREQVHRPRARFRREPVQHRQVITKRFPARRRRDDHDVRARGDAFIRFRLMRIRPRNAARPQHVPQLRIQRRRKLAVLGRARGRPLNGPDGAVVIQRHAFEFLHHRCQIALLRRRREFRKQK